MDVIALISINIHENFTTAKTRAKMATTKDILHSNSIYSPPLISYLKAQ